MSMIVINDSQGRLSNPNRNCQYVTAVRPAVASPPGRTAGRPRRPGGSRWHCRQAAITDAGNLCCAARSLRLPHSADPARRRVPGPAIGTLSQSGDAAPAQVADAPAGDSLFLSDDLDLPQMAIETVHGLLGFDHRLASGRLGDVVLGPGLLD